MKRTIPVGELVRFSLNTGHEARGRVVQRITERRQPVILLIEQRNGLRSFRLEDDVTAIEAEAMAVA